MQQHSDRLMELADRVTGPFRSKDLSDVLESRSSGLALSGFGN